MDSQKPCRQKLIGFWLAVAVWIGCSSAASLAAQPEKPSSRRVVDASIASDAVSAAEIESLVRQLGAADDASRKIAETKLNRIGGAAIEPLRLALSTAESYSDMEIRMRAERLLIEIQREEFKRRLREFLVADTNRQTDFDLPGWPQLASIVGNQRCARRMYVGMYEAQEPLFRALEQGSQEFRESFRSTSKTGLRQRTNAGRKLDTLSCLMFFSSVSITRGVGDPYEVLTPVEIHPQTRRLMATQLNRPEIVSYVNSCRQQTEIKMLIDHWLNEAAEDDYSFLNLRVSAIENFQLVQQADFLATVATGDDVPIQTRVRALEVLVPLASPENVGRLLRKLEPCLEEASLVGRFPQPDNREMLVIQFRDLALAACILMVNANPVEFGFQFSQSSDKRLDRSRCGFADHQLREKAMKKWRDSSGGLPGFPDR